MITYIWIMFVVYCLSVVMHMVEFARGGYPITRVTTAEFAAFKVAFQAGLAVWLGVLLLA